MKGNQSQLKQRINNLYHDVGRIIAGLLKSRRELICGSVYKRRRRCGKARCRCSRGALHEDMVYAVRTGARMRVRSIGKMEALMIKQGINQLRQYQRRRQDVAGGCKEILSAIDMLERVRTERYE